MLDLPQRRQHHGQIAYTARLQFEDQELQVSVGHLSCIVPASMWRWHQFINTLCNIYCSKYSSPISYILFLFAISPVAFQIDLVPFQGIFPISQSGACISRTFHFEKNVLFQNPNVPINPFVPFIECSIPLYKIGILSLYSSV